MNENTDLEDLQALFAQSPEPRSADSFTADVMNGTDKLKRWRLFKRICIGLLLALLLPPIQEYGLATTQLLLVTLIAMDGGLIAELLAPINSVGAALSLVLFSMRAFYLRLFT